MLRKDFLIRKVERLGGRLPMVTGGGKTVTETFGCQRAKAVAHMGGRIGMSINLAVVTVMFIRVEN